MKLLIGSDHAGYELKEDIKNYLQEQYSDISIIDKGCYSTASVDYPDLGQAVAEGIVAGEAERGIIICGTGIGISIAANKVPGIRAANCSNVETAKLCREHNNANILSLGARFLEASLAKEMVQAYLETEFAGDRHARRLEKITAIEKKYCK